MNVPGDFWVTYNPAKEKETYLVDITLQNGSLLGGKTIPVMFGEIACADPTKCEIVGIRPYQVGNQAAFKIVARDSDGCPHQ